MESTVELEMKKNKYAVPIVEVFMFSRADILCLSTEEKNDNEFDAGDLGNF
jgi:hypothetical protein